MTKNHLTRLTSPKTWQVNRKENRWIAKPMPGPHRKDMAVTLSFLLKDILGYAKTTKEAKSILNEGNILVDSKVRKELKFPIGLMDIIEIPKTKETFRILFNKKGKITAVQIDDKEKTFKICKVIKKTATKKNKIQVNLHDGKNILFDKFPEKVGDSVVFDFKTSKINKTHEMKKGANIMLIGGKNLGRIGKLVDIIQGKGLQRTKVIYEFEGNKYETFKDYIFVLGDEIKLK